MIAWIVVPLVATAFTISSGEHVLRFSGLIDAIADHGLVARPSLAARVLLIAESVLLLVLWVSFFAGSRLGAAAALGVCAGLFGLFAGYLSRAVSSGAHGHCGCGGRAQVGADSTIRAVVLGLLCAASSTSLVLNTNADDLAVSWVALGLVAGAVLGVLIMTVPSSRVEYRSQLEIHLSEARQ